MCISERWKYVVPRTTSAGFTYWYAFLTDGTFAVKQGFLSTPSGSSCSEPQQIESISTPNTLAAPLVAGRTLA